LLNEPPEIPLQSPDPQRMHAERVRIVYTTAPLNMTATLLNALILGVLLWPESSHALILLWVAANLAVTLVRYRLVAQYRRSETKLAEAGRWGRRFVLWIGATGVVWGAGGAVLFPAHSVVHQALLLLVFGGMLAGTVGAYASLEKVFPAYALPLLLPVTVRFLLDKSEVHFGIALLVLLFLLLMLGTSRRIHAIMSASIANRLWNHQLVGRLIEEKRSVEEVNERLLEQIRERLKVEKELQEAHDQVERRVQERTQELIVSGQRLREEVEQRLRAVEEKDRIFNLSRDLIAVAGPEGRFKLVNPAWERTLGYTTEELCSRPFLDFVHPEDRDLTRREIGGMSPGGASPEFENRYLHKDGSARVLSWTGTKVPEGLLYWVGRDVTQRKRNEEALRRISRAAIDFVRLEPGGDVYEFIGGHLAELLPGTVVVVNAYQEEGGMLETRSILGLEPAVLERVGRMLGAVLPGIFFQEIPKAVRDKLFSGRLQELEGGLEEVFFHRVPASVCREIEALVGLRGAYSIGFKRGGDLFGNVSLFPLSDDPPNREIVETFVNQASIVLDRRRADAEVRAAAAQWQRTFDSISDAVSLVDLDGVVLRSNRAMARLVGRPQEEVVGGRCWELVHGAGARFEECPIHRMRGSRQKEQTVLTRGDRTLEITVDPILDPRGEPVGAVHIVSDVTERLRMEEEVATAQKLRSVGVLAGGIAHDFNNILAIIWGNISLAKITLDPAEAAYRNLEQAEKGALRAKELSQKLLTFSKGGVPVRRQVRVESLLREAARDAASGSRVRAVLDFQEGLWAVHADEGQIREVFRNLILNAVQATPGEGVVEVRAENAETGGPECAAAAPGPCVRVQVRDRGVGIPREDITRVFDPYFTTKQQGNGLGLAVAYSVVAKHDGHIGVESEPGRGSVFTVLLPALEPGQPASGPGGRPAPAAARRVLVMDDEKMLRELVKEMLEHLGYQAELAADGGEALACYEESLKAGAPFDAVILDLTVPGGLGGREVIGRLREMDPGVRAIVSSGYSGDPVLARHEAHGFRGMIQKPCSLANLRAALEKVLA